MKFGTRIRALVNRAALITDTGGDRGGLQVLGVLVIGFLFWGLCSLFEVIFKRPLLHSFYIEIILWLVLGSCIGFLIRRFRRLHRQEDERMREITNSLRALSEERFDYRFEGSVWPTESFEEAYLGLARKWKAKKKEKKTEPSWTDLLPDNFAHEIRTPLSAVLGYVDLLSNDQALSATQREVVVSLQRASERLLNDLNNLSEYARLRKGIVSSKSAQVLAMRLFLDAYDFVEEMLRGKELEIYFDQIGPTVREFWTQRDKACLILMNLLKVVAERTDSGGLHIFFETIFEEGQDRGELEIVIEGTGNRLSKKEHDAIFGDAGDASDAGLYSEVSIALDLCVRLARSCGGVMKDCSHEEGGLCLALSLPVTRQGMDVLSSPLLDGFWLKKTYQIWTKNDFMREVMGSVLEKSYFNALRGEEVSPYPDLLVWDLPLVPDADEEESIKRMMDESPSTRLLILVNIRFNESPIEKSERIHLLTKPLFKCELIGALNSLIPRRQIV